MARSYSKVILFGKATHDRTVHLWPIAVFNDTSRAKAYSAHLAAAYGSGEVAKVKALDGHVRLTPEGELLTGVKFMLADAPYDPDVATPDVELEVLQ